MAASITKRLTKDIKEEVSRLLARGKTGFPCPFSPSELATIWHRMIPKEIVDAVELLHSRKYSMNGPTSAITSFKLDAEAARYKIKLVDYSTDSRKSVFIDLPDGYSDEFKLQDLYAYAVPTDWQDRIPAFAIWAHNCAVIERDFSAALSTLDQVLDFCGTIGQLVRAVPELSTYLTKKNKAALREQTRASNMPHAWAGFDRSRIDNLQMSLAKASLFPVMHSRTPMWDGIDGTWATFDTEVKQP